jgi:Predicted membrane protein
MTRVLSTIDSPSATAFYTTAVGAIGLSLSVQLFWVPLDTPTWGIMILAGFLGASGHGLIVLAYKSAEASALAPFTYSQILAAILWGYVVFGDVPSIWTIVGAAMIIAGGIYVWYSERRPDHLQANE